MLLLGVVDVVCCLLFVVCCLLFDVVVAAAVVDVVAAYCHSESESRAEHAHMFLNSSSLRSPDLSIAECRIFFEIVMSTSDTCNPTESDPKLSKTNQVE